MNRYYFYAHYHGQFNGDKLVTRNVVYNVGNDYNDPFTANKPMCSKSKALKYLIDALSFNPRNDLINLTLKEYVIGGKEPILTYHINYPYLESNLGMALGKCFEILNAPKDMRGFYTREREQ